MTGSHPPPPGVVQRGIGSGCSGSASRGSPASGSREGGWGCARTSVNCGMANGRLTDRKDTLWTRIKRVAMTDVGALMRGLNADDIERMERVLIEADFGVPATVELTQALEDEVRRGKLKTESDLRKALEGRLATLLDGGDDPGAIARAASGPTVVLMVGVNGTGKTTTAAKLARRLQREGRKVLLAAADTYRAGAITQLQVWADRLGIPCVAGEPGGDPASVAFNAIDAAQSRGLDTIVVDTAGQNAVQQGKLFAAAVSPTGIVVTKLDGSARGGAVAALRRELDLPIRFLGVGEGVDDLQPFDPQRFAAHLLADSPAIAT